MENTNKKINVFLLEPVIDSPKQSQVIWADSEDEAREEAQEKIPPVKAVLPGQPVEFRSSSDDNFWTDKKKVKCTNLFDNEDWDIKVNDDNTIDISKTEEKCSCKGKRKMCLTKLVKNKAYDLKPCKL